MSLLTISITLPEHYVTIIVNVVRCNRFIQIWNSLPDSVVESNSRPINIFENNLDKFWQNEDVKFNWKANLTGAGSRSLSLT